MFLLGVLGMVLFAAVDTGFAVLVKKFLDGAFVERDPRMLVYVPAGIIVLFLVRGVGDYLSVYAPGWVGRQVIKSIRGDVFARYLHLPVSYFDRNGVAQLLSRLTYNIELVAEAATNAVTFIIRDTLTIVGLIGYLLLPQLEADAVRARGGAADRRADPRDQPAVPALQRPHPGLDGRRHARREGIAREPADDQGVQRRGAAGGGRSRRSTSATGASFMKLITVKAVSNPVVQMIAAIGPRRGHVHGDPRRARARAARSASSRPS